MPPCPVFAVLGTEARALCMTGTTKIIPVLYYFSSLTGDNKSTVEGGFLCVALEISHKRLVIFTLGLE